jgi:hypothetical protein
MNTATTIPTTPETIYGVGHYKATTNIRIGLYSYGVGGWDATGKNRIVDQGPMVPGPHAYAYHVPVMLTDHVRPDEAEVVCEIGDVVTIDGHDYRIESARNHNIDLIPVN